MRIAFLTPFLFLAGPALAEELDCADAQTQMAMNVCADRDYRATDRALNETYEALLARVDADGKDKLRAAQRAWIAYRDAQCAFDTAGTADGSIHPMMVSQCLGELTKAQTGRLDAQMNCEEGDLSCAGR